MSAIAGSPAVAVRNIAMMTLKPGVARAEVEQFVVALRTLRIEGMLALDIQTDLGFRDGNADLAIISDFEDEASYQRYDLDPEHQRIRATLAAPITQHAVRIQFAIDPE